MNINKVRHLVTQDESLKLDFKLKLSIELDSEKKELVKDIIAMVNTHGGRRYIIFDVREIVGIEDLSENIEERIQQIIANRSMPPVTIAFDVISYEGKKLGIITV
ncbi:AlbA family DNA-binding domain-containing protein [Cellulosilyticum ruminicola]|uniref:AlbA family DNA-binding domain-containing protein n=1 Tax=Cellulosilyticum ruminicola TaxID=425254 RepID=UPI0006CF4C03|nr:ATP-binding protein [Cellulosilyticum ruminicola]